MKQGSEISRSLISAIAWMTGWISAAACLPCVLAQNAPFSANATVRLVASSPIQQKDREFKVDLIVNLNAAGGVNGAGAATAATLGAYLINIGFTPADFQLLGVEDGTAAEFAGAPVFTHPSIANVSGYVGVVNAQNGTTHRTGDYLVARLRLKPIRCFASSLLVPDTPKAPNSMSLSSAYLAAPSPSGPALIGFQTGPSLAIRSVLRGDANGDEGVNSQDVVAAIRAVFDAGARNGLQDCNQDSRYTVADVLCVVLATVAPGASSVE